MARATNTSQPRHNILKLKPARDNALFKRRRAGTIQELWGELASRAKEFECRYVTDADGHGTTLSGSHPSAEIGAKKVPRTQTEARHESNTFSQKRAKVRQTMTLQKLYLRRYWQSIPRRTKQSAGNYILSQKTSAPFANANGAEGLTSLETKQIDARHRTRQGQSAVELSPQTQLEEQTRGRARRARPLAR